MVPFDQELPMAFSNLSIKIDTDLMQRFEEVAGPADGEGAAVIRDLIADFVATHSIDPGYDDWLRKKVSRSMQVARAGGLVDSDDVEAEFAARHDESRRKLGAI